jgi:predicted nucleotidyltransferase
MKSQTSMISSVLLRELQEVVTEILQDKLIFSVIYGSYAVGSATEKSDIDIVSLCEHVNETMLSEISLAIHNIHVKYGLSIDDEVPYEVKLLADPNDVIDSLCMRGFITSLEGEVTVPPIKKTKEFLSSRNIKLRLLFNALTSQSIFIAGCGATLLKVRREAARRMMALAIVLTQQNSITIDKAVLALTKGLKGESNEWYLGYGTTDECTVYIRKSLICGAKDLMISGLLAGDVCNEIYILEKKYLYQYLLEKESSVIIALSRS